MADDATKKVETKDRVEAKDPGSAPVQIGRAHV